MEKKRARQTEEQSASLGGLVCLAAASLGVCPGASVAWRRGTRLCSHRWRRASSAPLPVSRIDCAGPSQPLLSSCHLGQEPTRSWLFLFHPPVWGIWAARDFWSNNREESLETGFHH